MVGNGFNQSVQFSQACQPQEERHGVAHSCALTGANAALWIVCQAGLHQESHRCFRGVENHSDSKSIAFEAVSCVLIAAGFNAPLHSEANLLFVFHGKLLWPVAKPIKCNCSLLTGFC